MSHSKLKIFLCLTVCLMLLFAPFFLDVSPDGKTYAFSSKKGNRNPGVTSQSGSGDEDGTFGYTIVKADPGSPAPVPEPATMLLVGGGLLGLAAIKKKFRKK